MGAARNCTTTHFKSMDATRYELLADAVALWICSATIAQRVLSQESCEAAGVDWNQRQPECAGKRGPGHNTHLVGRLQCASSRPLWQPPHWSHIERAANPPGGSTCPCEELQIRCGGTGDEGQLECRTSSSGWSPKPAAELCQHHSDKPPPKSTLPGGQHSLTHAAPIAFANIDGELSLPSVLFHMTSAAPESSRLPPSWTELGFVRAHLGFASIKTGGGTTTKIGGPAMTHAEKGTRQEKKTRRRMARERRGAGFSLVSTETPYLKTIH